MKNINNERTLLNNYPILTGFETYERFIKSNHFRANSTYLNEWFSKYDNIYRVKVRKNLQSIGYFIFSLINLSF